MSAEAIELPVFTVPSNFMGYNPEACYEATSPVPYPRIVGLEDTDGSKTWTAQRVDWDFRGHFTPDVVDERALVLDERLHEKLRAFFDSFFVSGLQSDINCNFFGVDMFDLEGSGEPMDIDQANWIMRDLLLRGDMDTVADIEPEKLGIVGANDRRLGILQPIHSFIRLHDGQSTLQVTGVGGHLGIFDLPQLLSIYGQDALNVFSYMNREDIKLYSPRMLKSKHDRPADAA